MGRQTQLHIFPRDVNDLLIAMHAKEPLQLALERGNTATPEPLAFAPDSAMGHDLVLWSERLAPGLQRDYIANANPPYYLVDEQTEAVFELSLSKLTTWEGRPALVQGRIYGVFEGKPAEFTKLYERIVRYIRRHWRKNPADSLRIAGYVGPAAYEWFEQGGLLLPNYVPPVRPDWIQRLGEQHPQD